MGNLASHFDNHQISAKKVESARGGLDMKSTIFSQFPARAGGTGAEGPYSNK